MSRDHYAEIEQLSDEFAIKYNGKEIARSSSVKALDETHPRMKFHPVYYFPPDSVDMDLLKKTDHHTRCPIKGKAHYWTIELPEKTFENAVWAYPPGDSLDHSKEVEGWFAFDISQGLELYRNGERVMDQRKAGTAK